MFPFSEETASVSLETENVVENLYDSSVFGKRYV